MIWNKTQNKHIVKLLIISQLSLFFAFVISGCYSFSGASIPPNIKTFSVDMFQNRAELVNPVLSTEFTNELRSYISSRSSLTESEGMPDIQISGEITGYSLTPMAAQADGQAENQRFTITVKVNFANNVTTADSFSESFSKYRDFSSTLDFSSVEDGLKNEIKEEIINDIFMRAFANW